MKEAKTILIVDDAFANRALLHKIFASEYQVREAENGRKALEMMRDQPWLSAVILDIVMPELDGYGVLREMNADAALSGIPVIVVTGNGDAESQIRALDLGALDVITKPFSPEIVLHRVRNIIFRRETDRLAEQNRLYQRLLRQSEMDEKTGIYNKRAFCRVTAKMLHDNPDKQYVVCRWDVDRFKVYNDVYGMTAGDEYLARIGELYRRMLNGRPLTFGHWEADHFVACVEREDFLHTDIADVFSHFASEFHPDFEFVARVGVYPVDDPMLDVELMCDRALLALRSIKNSYSTRMAWYDDSMRAALLEEQEIINEMGAALADGQFLVYLQPQYDYAAGTLHGAEALVRWAHPVKGLVPPGKFIPVFERNGFISQLDEYVWERVCALQRRWLDAGMPIAPVSVNISRIDIYNPHLCGIFGGLLKKYGLDASLLRLEITESAYMENPEQLVKVVGDLRGMGFHVEMDDFGSGYSSLNMLKEVPVDTLKLDMAFLRSGRDAERSGSILSSIVRMASWIRLPVLAEGVETRESAEYLKSIGCHYMQGYYFAKPMPVDDYEKVLRSAAREAPIGLEDKKESGATMDFLNASAQSTLLFNSYVGGAAIVEWDGENVEALRLNDQFFKVIDVPRDQYAGRELRLLEQLEPAYGERLRRAVQSAVRDGVESECLTRFKPARAGEEGAWCAVRLRCLARSGGRSILYLSVDNITERMNLTLRNERLTRRLSEILDNMPGAVLDFEIGERVRIAYVSHGLDKMFGYTREEYERAFCEAPFSAVHPEDIPEVREAMARVLSGASPMMEQIYRHRCKDGDWRWARLSGRIVRRDAAVYATGFLMECGEAARGFPKREEA